MPAANRLIALTGSTGYVGGRLAPLLLEKGYRIRCLVRDPRKLNDRAWRQNPAVEVVTSDLSDADELAQQLEGCEAAYYLVHSMAAAGKEYADKDLRLASNFAEAAKRSGVGRLIYLGGLGETKEKLSEHLQSRREVETALGSGGVPVTCFRAAMIVGSGSASFEILRYLVHRLPIMITPRWVQTECQPIAIADVLYWLIEALATPETTGKVLEFGGPNVLTYCDLMQVMAQELGLRKRLVLPVPVLTPRLSSAWISLVTPVTFSIARPLAEGLRNRVVVTNDETQRLMPHRALTVRESIQRSLAKLNADQVPTSWSVAGTMPGDPEWAGGKEFHDERRIVIHADADAVFGAVCRVGGGHGWYAGDLLWRLRGWIDKAVGGPGLRRGRRNAAAVEYGDALDFWRVVEVERPHSLKLHAEMKLPGIARLEFQITPETAPQSSPPSTRLSMTARFWPTGLLGLAYWYSVLPLHHAVFSGMLGGIKRAAEAAPVPPVEGEDPAS